MNIGDKVRTTEDWSTRYWEHKILRGRVVKMADVGPLNPARRIQVEFPEPVFWDFYHLWFDPEDLELDDQRD